MALTCGILPNILLFVLIGLASSEVLYKGRNVVLKGGDISIECHAGKLGIPLWTKDGSPLVRSDDRISIVENDKGNGVVNVLHIANATSEDAGEYKCVDASISAHRIVILATGARLDSLSVIEVGKPFSLSCDFNNTREADNGNSVKWFKDNDLINVSDTHYVFENKTLKISHPTDLDAGEYVCTVYDVLNNTFTVSSKPRIKEHAKSINQVQGDTLALKCDVEGSPLPRVTWLKDGKEIENDTRISFIDDKGAFKLEIKELVDEDRAEYTCIAENDAGSVNSTTIVRVKDKLAALWPFLGIVAEVGVLCTIIFIYEKRRAKQEFEESDTDQSPDTKNVSDNKEKDVRQRKT